MEDVPSQSPQHCLENSSLRVHPRQHNLVLETLDRQSYIGGAPGAVITMRDLSPRVMLHIYYVLSPGLVTHYE
ncbi:hypothetical protein DTO169E5_3387 [Paecilomyces variotii]|nr:hypothetical protein DTO169E5_3387 [Paecilomyces variotii]